MDNSLTAAPSVVLASGSPQRRELLQKLGVEFEVVVPGVEELSGGDPEIEVVKNARRKALAITGGSPRAGGAVGGTTPEEALATAGGGGSPAVTGPARLVLACDTDVVLDGRALGKPADVAEAREYL